MPFGIALLLGLGVRCCEAIVSKDPCNAVFVIGRRADISAGLNQIIGIAHGNAKTGLLQHLDVVIAISHADDLLHGKVQVIANQRDRMGFVDTGCYDIESDRCTTGRFQGGIRLNLVIDLLQTGTVFLVNQHFDNLVEMVGELCRR